MRTKEAMRICRGLFASEPVISRVEGGFRPDDDDESSVFDLTFIVDGDLFDAERRVIPLAIELMRRMPEVDIDFMVLPTKVRPEPHGAVFYTRSA